MLFSKRHDIVMVLFAAVVASLLARPSWADLQEYVRKPEAEFGWKLKSKIDGEQSGHRIYDLHFVSQSWQGNKWKHQLQIYRPRDVRPNSTMLLWVTGGSARPASVALGM